MTSKEVNLWIIQYTYIISIDQKSHIKDTILESWLPYASDRVNSAPTPFNSDRSFKLDISETLNSNPAELHHLEERYLGKLSAHIGKILYMMQYTLPDLMCSVNRFYIHVADPSTQLLQGIKKLIRYLDGCPHFPIMYPYGLGVTTAHDLRT